MAKVAYIGDPMGEEKPFVADGVFEGGVVESCRHEESENCMIRCNKTP